MYIVLSDKSDQNNVGAYKQNKRILAAKMTET